MLVTILLSIMMMAGLFMLLWGESDLFRIRSSFRRLRSCSDTTKRRILLM